MKDNLKVEWEAVETEDGWAVKLIEKGMHFGECFICQEVCQGVDDGESDAKLIAAAPDLLEALREVVRISDRKHPAWDKAKSAINKAVAG
jgi:hypothetical protein